MSIAKPAFRNLREAKDHQLKQPIITDVEVDFDEPDHNVLIAQLEINASSFTKNLHAVDVINASQTPLEIVELPDSLISAIWSYRNMINKFHLIPHSSASMKDLRELFADFFAEEKVVILCDDKSQKFDESAALKDLKKALVNDKNDPNAEATLKKLLELCGKSKIYQLSTKFITAIENELNKLEQKSQLTKKALLKIDILLLYQKNASTQEILKFVLKYGSGDIAKCIEKIEETTPEFIPYVVLSLNQYYPNTSQYFKQHDNKRMAKLVEIAEGEEYITTPENKLDQEMEIITCNDKSERLLRLIIAKKTNIELPKDNDDDLVRLYQALHQYSTLLKRRNVKPEGKLTRNQAREFETKLAEIEAKIEELKSYINESIQLIAEKFMTHLNDRGHKKYKNINSPDLKKLEIVEEDLSYINNALNDAFPFDEKYIELNFFKSDGDTVTQPTPPITGFGKSDQLTTDEAFNTAIAHILARVKNWFGNYDTEIALLAYECFMLENGKYHLPLEILQFTDEKIRELVRSYLPN